MLKSLNKKMALILIVIAVGYLFMSSRLPSYPYVPVDADAVPIILGIILLVLSIALYFIKDEDQDEESKPMFNKQVNLILLGIFGLIILYILFLEIIGFAIVTMFFIFLCSLILGYKNHIVNLLVSIAVPFSFYYIFTYLLQIRLPQGILPF